jgi:uncharacterized protein (DUF433 family)
MVNLNGINIQAINARNKRKKLVKESREDQQLQRIRSLLIEGFSVKEVALDLGILSNKVYYICNKNGIDVKQILNSKQAQQAKFKRQSEIAKKIENEENPCLSEKDMKVYEMVNLRKAGMTLESIGAKFGMTRQGAWDVLARFENITGQKLPRQHRGCLDRITERRLKIIQLTKQGKNIDEIVDEIGTKKYIVLRDIYVYNKLHNCKVAAIPGYSERIIKLTSDAIRDIQEKRKKGVSLKELALQYDVHVSRISNVARNGK